MNEALDNDPKAEKDVSTIQVSLITCTWGQNIVKPKRQESSISKKAL